MTIDLFPSPVYVDYLNLNKTEIERLLSLPLYRNQDHEAWVSDTNIHKNPDQEHVFNRIQSHVEKYAYRDMLLSKDYVLRCNGAWLNKNDPGDFTSKHHHSNALISGVYYVKCDPKTQGEIQFYDDKNGPFGSFFTVLKYQDRNSKNSHIASISCENDMIILFPSVLKHSVPVNLSDSPRYSFAFDYMIHGEFDGMVNKSNFQIS